MKIIKINWWKYNQGFVKLKASINNAATLVDKLSEMSLWLSILELTELMSLVLIAKPRGSNSKCNGTQQ